MFNNTNLGQPADDMYHWIHSATIAYDKDIDYTEDYQIDNGTFNNITNVPSAPPGAGYIWSPFVFIFSQLDSLNFERQFLTIHYKTHLYFHHLQLQPAHREMYYKYS